MSYKKKRALSYVVVACLVLIASLCRHEQSENMYVSHLFEQCRSSNYIGLYCAWVVYLNKHVVETKMRKCLTWIGCLKVFWFKGHFSFLKSPAPWLILGATALGNGGVFCWYSYINPMLTNVSGFSAESITPLMILAGFGMVVGNLISGRLSDRYIPGKVGTAAQALICIMLLLIFFLSPYKWAAALLMCLCTAGLFAVSSPEQILIIRVSKGGEMLGAACVQVAFNLGNAIGAYAGGLAVSGGYRYPALAGVPFALIGFTLFLIFYKKYQARITEDDIIEND